MIQEMQHVSETCKEASSLYSSACLRVNPANESELRRMMVHGKKSFSASAWCFVFFATAISKMPREEREQVGGSWEFAKATSLLRTITMPWRKANRRQLFFLSSIMETYFSNSLRHSARQMAPADDGSTNAKPRRAQRACIFCRRRKLRCDNAQPCSTCKTYDQLCEFQPRPPKRLRISGKGKNLQQDSTAANTLLSPNCDPAYSSDDQITHSPREDSAPTRSTYHGLTSTLFVNPPEIRKLRPDAITGEWIQKGLMAEAAKQSKHCL